MKQFLISHLGLTTRLQVELSQENHYWSQRLGAISTLMGNGVVAGVRDNSTAFCNLRAQHLSWIDTIQSGLNQTN